MRMQIIVPQLTPFNMPRKKKETPTSIELKFTGKMSILVEQENHGPIEFRFNDMDTVMAVVRVILDKTDNKTSVDAYDARTHKTFTKILDSIT
jgi:hypothetical protein